VKSDSEHDVVIVGGGPVGAALALALADGKRSVLLVEARDEPAREDDPRSLALSFGSRLILERLGVWSQIASATAIQAIHVSHRGAFGRAVLTAAEAGLPALGYVVPHAALQRALSKGLQQVSNVTLLTGSRAASVEATAELVHVQFERGSGSVQRTAHAKLAVIADGGATSQGLTRMQVREYAQSALVANVLTSKPHQNWAFERFTPEGPLALLPREAGFALVWTSAPESARLLCSLPAPTFLGHLQTAFGERAGTFTAVEGRAAFALALRVAEPPTVARTLLLGNAAQTLHPVAGQGLNLGLRDAWELAEDIQLRPGDPGTRQVLTAYANRRRRDRASGVMVTDGLVRVFSNSRLPLRWLRGCGLTLLDSLPPIKRAFMQQMMFGRPL
jgi:2-octaprenyl-6-methoxyphenol hydroxylase